MTHANQSTTPSGGPATIGGVIFQMLWCLLHLTRYEIRRIDPAGEADIEAAVLILEPEGGGGDAREVHASKYVATQLKARSGNRSWSLREIIEDVLPDLLKAIKIDATDPSYRFVTDGRRGEWASVERFFQSLKSRVPGKTPLSALDSTNLLQVGAKVSRKAKPNAFWTKESYSERDLFVKIVDALVPHAQPMPRPDFELIVWHLLAHFEFCPSLSQAQAESDIDLMLSEVVGRHEAIPDTRRALLMRLAELARTGNTSIQLASFLKDQGLQAIPRSQIAALQTRCREVIGDRIRICGFDPSQHVQSTFTDALAATVADYAIVALVGESGTGKSWHSCALARSLSQSGALVSHIDAQPGVRATLDAALGMLWNTTKGQDEILPFDRAAKGLPGPPPLRVLVIDRVDEPALARDLALAGLEGLGIRLVVCVSPHSWEQIRQLAGSRSKKVDVPAFSPSQLSDYLVARRVPRGESIPEDVRELLSQPLFARIYCDLAAETGWSPKSEYDLFRAYWVSRLEKNENVHPTFDLSTLRSFARALLDGHPYPWRAGLVHDLVKHENSLARLSRSGWLIVHPAGECSLWHDRLLNWLLADMLVEEYLSGKRSAPELAILIGESFAGELRAGGRWMGYAAMDAMWLLAERGAPAAAFATALAEAEKRDHNRSLYREAVPTLGTQATAGLLARLDELLKGEPSYTAIDIASCLARLMSPEAVAKARAILMSESPEHQTIALHVLSRQGDPASLDRLWALHLRAEASRTGRVEYSRRMDALAAGIVLRPSWLFDRLAAATPDTPGLSDLVFLLSRCKDHPEAWRSLKTHLKAVVPAANRRCLVQCVVAFQDKSELELVHASRTSDKDFLGDFALAALAQLEPDAAIQALAESELRYLAFTRGWHLHRLLAFKPEEVQRAIRLLTAQKPGLALDLFKGAENEIDGEAFERVLDVLDATLIHALAQNPVDASSGALHSALSFVERILRPDLLERLGRRQGSSLAARLEDYLLAIGPRRDIAARLCDRAAFDTLEFLGSERLGEIVEAGLDSDSWFGQMDALQDAHKHATVNVRAKLRALTKVPPVKDNDRFVVYLATHALALLEDWATIVPLVIQLGLAVSPYLFEQRRKQPALSGPMVDLIRERLAAGERNPGLFLAAGLSRDTRLEPLIAATLLSGNADRDGVLAAAIALSLLETKDAATVRALASHLHDESLRERLTGLLFEIGTAEALSAIADALSEQFDPNACAQLGTHESFADVAAELAWKNRETADRSLSYASLVPLFGRIGESTEYLERLAFGMGRPRFDRPLRAAAIRGLVQANHAMAFRAADHALRDPLCRERAAMPLLMMELDAARAMPTLLEVIRTAEDELVERAIADALADRSITEEILAMLQSASASVRRVACTISSRRLDEGSIVEELRKCALDLDQKVGVAAMRSLREHDRMRGVAALIEEALRATTKPRRWLLLEKVAQHARGETDRPPILSRMLKPLYTGLSPLEGRRFDEIMNKGADDYERGVRERERRRGE